MLEKFKMTLQLFLATILSLPNFALAKVSINEVAWMGNDNSQYGEWIEFYNDSSGQVDLKDAVLYEGGGTTAIIKLTKVIGPGDYYLAARSTPSVPDPLNGLADDLGSFGGSGLSNSGENLVLKSASGDVLDSVDASSGWPAGDSASKQTMQRSGNSWITASSTPRSQNVSVSAVNDNSATPSDSDDAADLSSSLQNLAAPSSHSSPADLSPKIEEVKIIVSAGRNRLALAEAPVRFEGKIFNSKQENLGGNISWSFGDGQTSSGKDTIHAYKFPGTYVVVMNALNGGENHVARTSVRVVSPELAISEFNYNFVKIKNSSIYEANLGGWQLVSSRSSFVMPEDTIILPKSEIILPREATSLSPDTSDIQLLSPARNAASTFRFNSEQISNKPINPILATSSISVAPPPAMTEQRPVKLSHQPVSNKISTVKPKSASSSLVAEIKAGPVMAESVRVIEKPRSFLKIVLDMPARGFRYLKSFF